MPTEKPSSATNSTAQSLERLPSIPNLLPPEPPQFPSFKELVELDRAEQLQPQKTRRLSDLFDGTLGDPTLLVADFQRHPEKYGEESQEFLGQLASGTKSIKHLTSHERHLLNLATFDYYQTPTPKPKVTTAQRAATKLTGKPTRRKRIRRKVQKPKPRPGVDVPVTELPVYWWMQ